jgi:hypothetical protein
MKRVWLSVVLIGALLLCFHASAFSQAPAPLTPGLAPDGAAPKIAANSSPQALPNDGRSEAQIEVRLTGADLPLAGKTVTAKTTEGGGMLLISSAITDTQGIARFQYRAGMQPEAGRINFVVADAPETQASLEIPLAPVAYIDVELVSPEAYKTHLARQVSAAPIYKLEVSGFPEQLAADGGSLAALYARLTTVDGKPAPGVPLKVELVSGDGQLQLDKTATDTAGKVQFYFTAGYTPGTVTVRVTELSTGLTATHNIVLVKAGPARIELYYLDPLYPGPAREGALLPADGLTGMPMVAKITDLIGLPLAGAEVKLEILDSKGGWIEVLDPISDMEGLVEFTYYAGGEEGKVRLRAFVASGMKLNTTLGL